MIQAGRNHDFIGLYRGYEQRPSHFTPQLYVHFLRQLSLANVSNDPLWHRKSAREQNKLSADITLREQLFMRNMCEKAIV